MAITIKQLPAARAGLPLRDPFR